MSSTSQHTIIIALRSWILKTLDFFYPLFKRLLPRQTYHYLACGGGVAVSGLIVYFLSYNFLLKPGLLVHFGPFVLNRYIAAYVISFCISFPLGFFLSKFVVFPGSYLKGRVQLFRYAGMQFLNIFLNWAMLHFFAGFLGFRATPSQALISVILAGISYFFQRYISFRGSHLVEIPKEEDNMMISDH